MTTKKKNIVTIGGTSTFANQELAFTEISKALKTHKIPTKGLIVYGYEDSFELSGAYNVAEQWAKKNKVTFASGQVKAGGGSFADRKAYRDSTLAESSALLINLRNGNQNGGLNTIKVFEEKKVPVEIVNENPETTHAGEASNDVSDADLSPKALRKGAVPSEDDLAYSIEVYSKVAKKLLNYGCLMLDTETTGLKDTDEVIELAISDCATGVPVFNSLIKSDVTSSPFAFEVNKITKEMLEGQPTLGEVWENIEAIVGNRVVLASNAPFDERLLNQSLRKHGLTCSFIWQDIQTLYRNYSCQGNATQYRLKTVGMCKQLGIEAGTHRAKDDVQAQIGILQAMANKVVPDFEV